MCTFRANATAATRDGLGMMQLCYSRRNHPNLALQLFLSQLITKKKKKDEHKHTLQILNSRIVHSGSTDSESISTIRSP